MREFQALFEMDLCVTNRCNLSCSFCSEASGKTLRQEMNLDRQLSLIREAAELGLKTLHFSGGEPTLHEGLEKMVETAAESSICTRIITNGYNLDYKRICRLRDYGLNSFMFSIDGLQSIHNRLRGKNDSYQRVLQAVAHSLDCGIKTRVNITVWKDNRDDIIPLLKICEDMGVDIFSGFIGSPVGRASSRLNRILSPEEWRDLLFELRDYVSSNHCNISVVFEKGYLWFQNDVIDLQAIHGRGAGCSRLANDNEYLMVAANGDIFPCVFFMLTAAPLASVKEQNLKDALKIAPGRGFYRSLAKSIPECSNCQHVEICNSGCRGYSKCYYGYFFAKDPRCSSDAARSNFYIPLCPIMKVNLNNGAIDGSTDGVV